MISPASATIEAQEIATDVFCGTHNVRGAWDSAGDLAAGLLGTLASVGAPEALLSTDSSVADRTR